MSSKMENLDELLECAIREYGIIRHMEDLARREHRRRTQLKYFSYGVAACVIMAGGGLDLELRRDARSAGYAFIPADGQAGGSEITALMQERKIDQAQALIVLAKEKVHEEILAPVSSDPDYLTQLEADKDELNLLDAVCLLRKGKYFKAKKALKAIASANGAFAEEARTLLKEL